VRAKQEEQEEDERASMEYARVDFFYVIGNTGVKGAVLTCFIYLSINAAGRETLVFCGIL
jgi:hypothetical protein